MSGRGHIYKVVVHEMMGGTIMATATRIEADYKKVTAMVRDCMGGRRVTLADLMKIENQSIGDRFRFCGWARTEEDARALAERMLSNMREYLVQREARLKLLNEQLDAGVDLVLEGPAEKSDGKLKL